MANASIKAAFERMWQHIITKLNSKADTSELDEITEGIFTEMNSRTEALYGAIDDVESAKADAEHSHNELLNTAVNKSMKLISDNGHLYFRRGDTDDTTSHYNVGSSTYPLYKVYTERLGNPNGALKVDSELDLSTPLSVSDGGTGATTAAAARTNLGITPANIGAVKTTGDTMTGNLKVDRSADNVTGTIGLVNTRGDQLSMRLGSASDDSTVVHGGLYHSRDDTTYNLLRYNTNTHKISEALLDYNALGIPQLTSADVEIYVDDDLDDFTTPGTYRCAAGGTAETLANCPTVNNFHLEVYAGGTSASRIQVITNTYQTSCPMYIRRYYGNAWGEWRRIVTDSMFSYSNGTLTIDMT